MKCILETDIMLYVSYSSIIIIIFIPCYFPNFANNLYYLTLLSSFSQMVTSLGTKRAFWRQQSQNYLNEPMCLFYVMHLINACLCISSLSNTNGKGEAIGIVSKCLPFWFSRLLCCSFAVFTSHLYLGLTVSIV